MSFLFLYVIFATATALSACYEILREAMASIKDPNDALVANKLISYIVMFCISWVFAPFMLFVILVPGLHAAAVVGLVTRDDKKF